MTVLNQYAPSLPGLLAKIKYKSVCLIPGFMTSFIKLKVFNAPEIYRFTCYYVGIIFYF